MTKQHHKSLNSKFIFKPFIFQAKQIKRNSRHAFVEEILLKTAAISNPRKKSYTFYSSKLMHFFKFSFREKRVSSFAVLDK